MSGCKSHIVLRLLALTLICVLLKIKVMDYVLLGIQTLLGIVAVFLVFFSTFCCTEWSWLIIPFNPLPLIFWKWRRKWALPYAIGLIIWCAFMFFWPHILTDNAYILMVAAMIISYAGIIVNSQNAQRYERDI